jgi:alpha-ribazole phosphatase/probable phosphoglycerate mutase
VSTTIVFETHSISEDNERGLASGWLPGTLSAQGQALARDLGDRRRDDGLSAVFTSDLARAAETVAIAFESTDVLVLSDWRLRECDYGDLNGSATAEVHTNRRRWLTVPYPGGESWRQAVARNASFLRDVPTRWNGQRILVVGHVATRLALDHRINGVPLEDSIDAEFVWRPGWEYHLP